MNTKTAISLLSTMEVEQRTLKDLFGQFTVAIAQLSSVLEHYHAIQTELPDMEVRHEALRMEIEHLEIDLTEKRKSVQEELTKYRQTLEQSIAPLEKQVKDERERAIAVQATLKEMEKSGEMRRNAVEAEIAAKEGDLIKATEAYTDFMKKAGVGV